MTNEFKDQILNHFLANKNNDGSLVLEHSKLDEQLPITLSDLKFLVEELVQKGLISISDKSEGHGFYLLRLSGNFESFVKNGGFVENYLTERKNIQLELDVKEASLRSATAAEVSATAAIDSAKEAKYSKYVAIFAALIALCALIMQWYSNS